MTKQQVVWLWVALLPAACLPAACRTTPPTPPTLTPERPPDVLYIGLAGSAALADLVVSPYSLRNDRAVLQFIVASNTMLLTGLSEGQFDAVLVYYLPEDSGFWFNPVAVDGLVIIIHSNNPVSSLSLGEVQAIFNGRITNWSAVGGRDEPITLYSRETGAGTRILFTQRVMAEQRISINTVIEPDNQAMLAAVAADPTAIGYTMMASAGDVRMLAIDGIPATPNEVGSQRYPLTAPLYFVSAAEPTGELRAFLAWLQSLEGQAILDERFGRVR